jgi:hypothetical protein
VTFTRHDATSNATAAAHVDTFVVVSTADYATTAWDVPPPQLPPPRDVCDAPPKPPPEPPLDHRRAQRRLLAERARLSRNPNAKGRGWVRG